MLRVMDPKLPNSPDKYRAAATPDVVESGFTCGLCGGLAAWVSLVAAGAPEPESWARDELLSIGTPQIGVEAGTLSCHFGGSSVDDAATAVRAALVTGDPVALHAVNDEYAPFWCPDCATSYCGHHWTTWPIWDADMPDFLDEVRGRCPNGHERTIRD